MSKQKKEVLDPVTVFISVPEASKRFGYTKGAIYNLVKKGSIINTKNFDGTVYVSSEDLQKRAETNKKRIKANKKAKKLKKEVVSVTTKVKTKTTNFQTGVIILAGIVGSALGFLIATLTR